MRSLCFAAALLVTSLAHAHAWTRDTGSGYVNLTYSRIAAKRVFGPDGKVVPIVPYTQQVVGLYGEVGLATQFLTATVEATLFRHNALAGQGATYGLGDLRLGVWTGLVTRPVRLAVGWTVGIPSGDSRPRARGVDPRDTEAHAIARSLPVGDGEWDVEARASLGYSFGGRPRYPLRHYLLVEAGYWVRSSGFADSFVYRLELGVQLPWRGIDRFWFIVRFAGVESFASGRDAARDASGLGNGVTFASPGVEVAVRLHRGLGLLAGFDTAVRARSVAAAAQGKVGLSYTF